ncbi:MAG: [FeFe] hydrogenase H-cluster radical SAM maturase HydE [Odoribacter sp.]
MPKIQIKSNPPDKAMCFIAFLNILNNIYAKIRIFTAKGNKMEIETLLQKQQFDQNDLIALLTCKGTDEEKLFAYTGKLRDQKIGNGVYLRGLIEISNVCSKDCLYCGIRKSNSKAERYSLSDQEIIESAAFAFKNRYGSIVLQGGERTDQPFILRIEKLLQEIKQISNNQLGITLSLGEQTEETFKIWKQAGAHRYLLRIETSNEELYRKIHPNDALHNFHTRLDCLRLLQKCGYQTGTGVMIGLPFQTIDDLANDLLFLQSMDIDMVGMGPYLEHRDTPLWQYRDRLLPQKERLQLSLRMVSCLRLLMPDINIAATTALQAIDPAGREKALSIGANVIMPNITPTTNRANYKLYENKPGMDEGAEASTRKLIESIRKSGGEVKLGEWGDSQHFQCRLSIDR